MKIRRAAIIIILFLYTIIPLTLSASNKPTIAVLRFENKSAFDRLDPFEIALPYMLISDLSKISGIQLVERDKIDKLMAETGLAEKDLMDPATMQKTGKALGADIIIIGSFVEQVESGMTVEDMSESDLTINVKVKKVTTGKIFKEIQVVGKSKEFFKLEKEIVQELIKVLNMSLTKDIRKQVDRISTRSLEAVLHFGRGEYLRSVNANLDFGSTYRQAASEKREQILLKAIKEFETCLYLDPQYVDAQYMMILTFRDLAGLFSNIRNKYNPKQAYKIEAFISQFPEDVRCKNISLELAWLYFCIGYGSVLDKEKSDGYYSKSIEQYKRHILKYDDKECNCIRRIVGVLFRKKDYQETVKWHKYLLEHYHKKQNLAKVESFYYIFYCYKKMKKYDKALETLNYMIKNRIRAQPYLYKNNPETCNFSNSDIFKLVKLKGDIYFDMGKYQKTVDEWLKIREEVTELGKSKKNFDNTYYHPFTIPIFWLDLANAYEKLNRREQVMECLEKSVSFPSSNDLTYSAYYRLGQLYEDQGDYKKALSKYKTFQKQVGTNEKVAERIFICKQRLEIIEDDKLANWLEFSPFGRDTENRFAKVSWSRGERGEWVNSIASYKHSIWIAFGGFSKTNTDGKYTSTGDWHTSLYSLNLNSMTEEFIGVPDKFRDNKNSLRIYDIAVDDKEIWLSCGKNGVLRYEHLLKKWTHFTKDNGLIFNTSHCIALSKKKVWCGLGGRGKGAIMAYDREKKKWLLYHHPIATAVGITALALDWNNIWVGNEKGIISYLNTQDSSWKIYSENKYSVIKDICVTEDAVWFACSFDGIKRYNKKEKQWETWDWDDPEVDYSLESKCISVNGNNVWVGENAGVYKLDTLSNRFNKVESRFFKQGNTTLSITACDKFVWFLLDAVNYPRRIMVYAKEGIKRSALKVNKLTSK